MVYPVLLWGGPSTPLWHLCCTSCPKQFLRHFSDESQFRATERRLWDDGLASPRVITGSDYCFIISELLQDASIVTGFVHIEPEVHDIAPAILAPALLFAKADPDAIMLDAFAARAPGCLISGAARVWVEDVVHLVGENELVYLP